MLSLKRRGVLIMILYIYITPADFIERIFLDALHVLYQTVAICQTSTFKGSWDENFTNIRKISSLYSQSHLVVIHNTPVVESHPTTRDFRDLLWPRSTPTGNTVYLHTENTQMKLQTYCSMKILWKIITCLLCYGI